MNVRDLEISLRPRTGWEAVDLGFMLTRSHYRALLQIGFTAILPVALVVLILFWKLPYVAPLFIWWVKPIFDRYYLHYLSRRIFGNEISVKEVRRKGLQFWFKGSLPLVLWRRFTPWRSMTLPVHDLEGLKGAAYGSRSGVVCRVSGETAILTTGIIQICEALFVLSVFGFLFIMMPQFSPETMEAFFLDLSVDKPLQQMVSRFSTLIFILAFIFLEPFYVGAGFCLYLNSRCSQEAWDVELRFREFANRVSQGTLKVGSSLILTVGMLFLVGEEVKALESSPHVPPIDSHMAAMGGDNEERGIAQQVQGNSYYERNSGLVEVNNNSYDFNLNSLAGSKDYFKGKWEGSPQPEKGLGGQGFSSVRLLKSEALPSEVAEKKGARAEDPQEAIAEVYADEDFKIHTIKYQEWEPDDESEGKMDDFFDWLSGLGGDGLSDAGEAGASVINSLFKLIGIIALSALVLLLAYVLFKLLRNAKLESGVKPETLKKAKPETVLGMEVTAESLPEDVLGEAQRHWEEGDHKQALSLLYRSALSQVIIQHDAEVESSDTEYECLRAARKVLPAASGRYFNQLTDHWITVAYSKDLLSGEDFSYLIKSWVFTES